MESQPQNPEFRTNPEKFHPCNYPCYCTELMSGHFVGCLKG